MMKSIENKGKTATTTLKKEDAGKASMPEVRRRVVGSILFCQVIFTDNFGQNVVKSWNVERIYGIFDTL